MYVVKHRTADLCVYFHLCKNSFSHDAAHILNLIKTVGRPEIVNIKKVLFCYLHSNSII